MFEQDAMRQILGPKHNENLHLWCKYVDEHGKTTLRPLEYKELRLEMAKKAAIRKKEKDAKKKAAGKF